jgi:Zn-dependent protease
MTILIWIVTFALLALTIIIHEVAHGFVSDRLGDPTARVSGRLTLNPIPHIDIYGTILVPLFMVIFRMPFVFGWAKPVPVDPYNLANPKKDMALISLAGPLSNIILATILAIILRFVSNDLVFTLLLNTIQFNVALAVFNLIPIHPLDGGKILVGLLPNKEAHEYDFFMNKYGMILLVMIIFPIFGGVSLISPIIYPVIRFILNLLV